jgi:hypothetical protein
VGVTAAVRATCPCSFVSSTVACSQVVIIHQRQHLANHALLPLGFASLSAEALDTHSHHTSACNQQLAAVPAAVLPCRLVEHSTEGVAITMPFWNSSVDARPALQHQACGAPGGCQLAAVSAYLVCSV